MENLSVKVRDIEVGHKILKEHFDFRNERHLYVSILMIILALSINVLALSIVKDVHAFSIQSVFTPAGAFTNVGSLVTTILQILISFAGALAMIFIILSGIKLVTSSGDPQKIAAAKNTLLYAIIGLAVAVLAFVIVQVVSTIFGSSIGTGSAGGVGGGAARCSISGSLSPSTGDTFTITYRGFAAGESIILASRLSGATVQNFGTTADSLSGPRTTSTLTYRAGAGGYSVMVQTRFPIKNFVCADVNIGAGGGAASCTISGSRTPKTGDTFTVTHRGFAAGESIILADRLGGTIAQNFGATVDSLSSSQTTPTLTYTAPAGGYSVMVRTRFPIRNYTCADVDITSGGVAASCTYNGVALAKTGDTFTVTHRGFAAGESIILADRLGGTIAQNFGATVDSLSSSQTTPTLTYTAPAGGYSVMVQTRFPVVNFLCSHVTIISCAVGDFNGDRRVSAIDQSQMAVAMTTGVYNVRFDLNKDGRINSLDQVILASVFGCTY